MLEPVRVRLAEAVLPDHPDWPTPQRTLGSNDTGTIYFATTSPYDLAVILGDMTLAPPTTGLGYLSYPDTATPESPVPAMVILPGSGGIAPGREHEYAQWFNSLGIAAFVVEYYASRGFEQDANYLVRTASVTEFDLIADAYAALTLLGTSPLIDPQRIGLIGFSYGGMAARLAMDERIHQALAPAAPPFSLHIDNYGPCFQNLQSRTLTGAPLLTLRGTEDASNDLQACTRRENELRELGASVTAHVYEGAGHAWENSAARFFSEESPYLAGCEVEYDAQGRAMLNGQTLTGYPIDAPHAAKMLARLGSGSKFKDCVGYGYTVGRNEKARAQGYRDIEAFIDRIWTAQAGS